MDDNNGSERVGWDYTRIDIGDPYQVRWWCQQFVCTEAMLRTAVAKFGSDPRKLTERLALGGAVTARRPGQRVMSSAAQPGAADD